MIADGTWTTRRERKKRVQQPRRRRACFGELIQIDGCLHHWFEDRGPQCTALVYVDDATGLRAHPMPSVPLRRAAVLPWERMQFDFAAG